MLEVVDLDHLVTDRIQDPGAPPALVVGFSRTGAAAAAPAAAEGVGARGTADVGWWCDVVLLGSDTATAAGVDGRPDRTWVAVADVDRSLDLLARAVDRNPQAASVLVQLLRHRPGPSLAEELLSESLAYSTLQAGAEHRRWLAARTPRQRPAGVGDPVRLDRAADVLHITLDRPHVRNAYNAAMRDALCEALTVAALDPSITEVVLRGAGPDFCSGGDLDEFGTGPDPAGCHLIRTRRSAARLLGQVAPRVTAEVRGACVGAGVELAAMAGRVVATPDARFRLPEVAMGLVPGAGGTASVPRRIGRHRTAWLALTGEWLSADQARAWGLVDELRSPGPAGRAPVSGGGPGDASPTSEVANT